MRVKTPWIDALNKSREENQTQPSKSAEPDLRPKKMSDTFYSAVSCRQFTWPWNMHGLVD